MDLKSVQRVFNPPWLGRERERRRRREEGGEKARYRRASFHNVPKNTGKIKVSEIVVVRRDSDLPETNPPPPYHNAEL
jgi:hypothetical protein